MPGLNFPSLFGLAPYGFRHEESVYSPFSAKGKGFFGQLPNANGGVSTEISAHDDMGQGFPLMSPNLTSEELAALLRGNFSSDIYKKAEAWAATRRALGLSPFAQQTEMRVPTTFFSNFFGQYAP